jgi:glycosyltransferase involved in cell wall biosynthesis
MVQYLVDGFRADPSLGVEVYHVDARLSDSLEDVGSARGGKLTRLIGYALQALRLRWRHGIRDLYYVPSPPKRNSLYRDWIVLALLRPWFRRIHFHWHAVGLGEWLDTQARPWERLISHGLLGGVAHSILLSEFNRPDAARLAPRSISVVGNGIPDPCAGFEAHLAAERQARLARRRDLGGEVQVLFLALCSRDKGVFDALEAIAIANTRGAAGAHRLRFRLAVAGTFPTPDLEREFDARVRELNQGSQVERLGFMKGDGKFAALREADLFLFPTYYAAEGQPLNLMEAMAHGLPVVTTRWRAIPDVVPPGYPGLIPTQDPAAAATALVAQALTADGLAERAVFEQRFALPAHLRAMAAALRK